MYIYESDIENRRKITQYRASCSHVKRISTMVCHGYLFQKSKQMSTHLSNPPSVIAMTLAMASMISPADAQTSSTTCSSTSKKTPSPQCCWVKRSWELMGQTTSVSSTSSTACCYYLGSTTQTSGIPGIYCSSDGIVTKIHWGLKSLRYSIPTELSNLKNLQMM